AGTARWDEYVDEGARGAVVAEDAVIEIGMGAARDVQIAVGSKDECRRRVESAAARRHKGVDERAGHSVIPEDVVRRGAGDVQVAVPVAIAVRSEDQTPKRFVSGTPPG